MAKTIVEIHNAVVGNVRACGEDRVAVHLAAGKISKSGTALKDCDSVWYTVFMDKDDAPKKKDRVDVRGFLRCKDNGYGTENVLAGARVRAHVESADAGEFED